MPCQCLWPWPSLGRIVWLQLNKARAYGRSGLPGLCRGACTWQKPETTKVRGLSSPSRSPANAACCILMNCSLLYRWRPTSGENDLPKVRSRWQGWLSPPHCPTLGFVSPASSGRTLCRAVSSGRACLAAPCLFFCLLHQEAEFMGLEVASPTERNTLLHSWEEYYWLL